MPNSIPQDVEQFVAQQLAAGQFQTPDELAEAVRSAAAHLMERDRRLEQLRGNVQPALDRLDLGQGRMADFEDIKRRGKERLATETPRD